DENTDIGAAEAALKRVFGIIALTRAYKGSLNFDIAKSQAQSYLKNRLMKAKSFKVIARRADKSYPLTSPQIGSLLGEYLLDQNPHLTVDLHTPDIIVYAEVREGNMYLHANPEKGAGGLPAGISGHGLLMISGGIDSPVAGYAMSKRGLRLSAIHFESPPYTSERARQKVIQLIKKLSRYAATIDLYIVPFTEIQETIRKTCKEDYFTVIMRRFMLRIACDKAALINAKAIITGESLGQVASQTLDAIVCTDAISTIPVFRPLIGTDKQDIINIARNIDTFDISIEPYEDCCTVFTPKHPKTNPILTEIENEENKLDIQTLLLGLQEKIEKVVISE
ncbi:MAG: tRNA 4-thiouridine(8) synthase ThiI, partial [Clostridia bacterium]|nr:tRNA 4-thiouridine(8) synthase ThiI [Clostridia bacterium]